MTYRELLELYKKNELEESKKEKVEADIERQEAIGDYLYEQTELVGMDTSFEQNAFPTQESDIISEQEYKFTKLVKRTIRRAFLKMGIAVGATVLFALLFIQFALPRVISSFYYNPDKEIADNTNQISLDMAIYTELLIPCYNRDDVAVVDRGYGDYDISINQIISNNGMFTNISGRIEKGKLTLYDTNVLKRPVSNTFAWSAIKGYRTDSLQNLISKGQTDKCAAGGVKYAKAKLNELEDNTFYVAYVTLNNMMTYEQLIDKMQGEMEHMYSTWCAVSTSEAPTDDSVFTSDNIGFQYGAAGSRMLEWDREKYPNLLLWDQAMEADGDYYTTPYNLTNEAFMKQHFVSMLRYLSDQRKFLTMMKEEADTYSQAADYVEKNGLTIYGLAGIADKKTLLKMSEVEEVYEIYTQPLK